ncbi:hypothetical protein [Vibrio campbellii]
MQRYAALTARAAAQLLLQMSYLAAQVQSLARNCNAHFAAID